MLVTLLLVVFGFFIFEKKGNPAPVYLTGGFCGVDSDLPTPRSDSINAYLGRGLFVRNCATCHNSTMKLDMTGPALAGALAGFDGDTA